MVSEKSTTRAGLVYEQVKDDIMRGDLAPGQRLRFVEFAERFTVSQSVIREAFTRLAEQGLLTALPQQGFRVVTLSLKDLNELTEARCEVETVTLRYSIERGDVRWESELVAAHHHLASTPMADESGEVNAEWFDVHERFHQVLLEGCGNDRLLDVSLAGREAASLYRFWARPIGHDYDRDVAQEHRELLSAALARDAPTATRLLAEHIERTAAALRPYALSQEEPSDARPRPKRLTRPPV